MALVPAAQHDVHTPRPSISKFFPHSQSPLCEVFLDLQDMDAKLYNQQTHPPTPITSPTGSDAGDGNVIDVNRKILVDWGLGHDEIDCARRWDQKPLHHSAESIHMKLLSECAESLAHQPASLALLYGKYEDRMIEYNRRQTTSGDFSTAQSRAQEAADQLVSTMRLYGYSAEDMGVYSEATEGGRVTMELVAKYCEWKLEEINGRRAKAPKQERKTLVNKKPCRRSGRIEKLKLGK